MPTITVKNIPDTLYETLKHQAAGHYRSINSEIIFLIEQAMNSCKPVDPTEHLLTARSLRQKTADYNLSNKELTEAKTAGRP